MHQAQMHRLFLACTLVAASASTLAEPATPQLQPLQPEIRLPSITRKWKRPGDKDAPEISLEEIGRCMGQDVGMQRELHDVKQAQQQLESERQDIEKADTEVKQNALSLEAKRAPLQEQMTKFQSEGAALDQRLSAIEKKKGMPARSQADVNAINTLVGAYNADIAKHNKWRTSLVGAQNDFNKSVASYNLTVADLNQRSVVFNKHNDEFQSLATALTKKSEQFVSNCAGEHTLIKK